MTVAHQTNRLRFEKPHLGFFSRQARLHQGERAPSRGSHWENPAAGTDFASEPLFVGDQKNNQLHVVRVQPQACDNCIYVTDGQAVARSDLDPPNNVIATTEHETDPLALTAVFDFAEKNCTWSVVTDHGPVEQPLDAHGSMTTLARAEPAQYTISASCDDGVRGPLTVMVLEDNTIGETRRSKELEPKLNPDNNDPHNIGDPVNPFNGEFVRLRNSKASSPSS